MKNGRESLLMYQRDAQRRISWKRKNLKMRIRRQPENPDLRGKWPLKLCMCMFLCLPALLVIFFQYFVTDDWATGWSVCKKSCISNPHGFFFLENLRETWPNLE